MFSRDLRLEHGRGDEWIFERKVKTQGQGDDAGSIWNEGELGDSCCFGVRTVEVGLDGVWTLHGGA